MNGINDRNQNALSTSLAVQMKSQHMVFCKQLTSCCVFEYFRIPFSSRKYRCQKARKITQHLQSSFGKKTMSSTRRLSANIGGCWVAGFSRCSPCASLSVGTSSTSSSSPRRFLGCWGQRWNRPLSTCQDAVSHPTLPSDATGRPNDSRATIMIIIHCNWLYVFHGKKTCVASYLFGVFGRAGAVASGVAGSERAGRRFV